MTTIFAFAAGAAFLVAIVLIAVAPDMLPRARRWMAPAALSAAFAIYSTVAALREGPTGFWPEHTRNLWGNQIWFDLLLAAGVACAAIAPRARTVGMSVLPWLLLVAATGSIGLCAMFARLLYLESAKA